MYFTGLSLSVLLLLLSWLPGKGVLGEVVSCELQQEVCECSREAAECEFTLVVEKLQTFTSYEIRDGRFLTRAESGSPYYLDPSGRYVSARDPSDPDAVKCALDNVSGEQDFRDANCSIPMTVDGQTYRSFVAVNGRIPGPTLVVSENQTVAVEVINRLPNEVVSIHWHGLFQQKTPWMDGVAFVSQCPITPGGNFRYIFKAYPYGSYWYHSHVATQRTDGLFGGLIIREPEQVDTQVRSALGDELGGFIDTPGKHSLTFLDWEQDVAVDSFVRFHAQGMYDGDSREVPTENSVEYSATKGTDGAEVAEFPYWSGIINGRGRYSLNGTITPSRLSSFEVRAGNTYRFRLLGAQRQVAYKFSIDEHKLNAIASDGSLFVPREVDYIIVHAGERYDFLLTASGARANYWMRAETLEADGAGGFLGNSAEAVLHYAGRADPDPSNNYANVVSLPQACSSVAPCSALNCPFREFPAVYNTNCVHWSSLRALLPFASEQRPFLNLNQDCDDCLRFFNFFDTEGASVNGRNQRLPNIAYQTNPGQFERDTANGRNCGPCRVRSDNTTTPQCACTHVKTIASQGNIESVRLVLIGDDDFAHPIHLHGHKFFVVHTEFGQYSDGVLTEPITDEAIACDDSLCSSPSWRVGPPNLSTYSDDGVRLSDRLIMKDTIIIPAGAYIIVSIIADNPGYWFLHCHVEAHQIEGMAVILQEFPEGLHNPAPEGINSCGDFQWTLEDFYQQISGLPSQQQLPRTCILTRWYHTLLFFFALSLALLIFTCVTAVCCCAGCARNRNRKGEAQFKAMEEIDYMKS